MSTLGEVSSASVGVALLAVIVLEGGTYMVLFAPRRIAKLLQRGREEALAEYQTALTAWYERFKAARGQQSRI